MLQCVRPVPPALPTLATLLACPARPLVQLNIGLLLFNLFLPAFPLDGGRILADLMLMRGVGVERAAKVTAGTATVLGCAVLGLGIWRITYVNAGGGRGRERRWKCSEARSS